MLNWEEIAFFNTVKYNYFNYDFFIMIPIVFIFKVAIPKMIKYYVTGWHIYNLHKKVYLFINF